MLFQERSQFISGHLGIPTLGELNRTRSRPQTPFRSGIDFRAHRPRDQLGELCLGLANIHFHNLTYKTNSVSQIKSGRYFLSGAGAAMRGIISGRFAVL